MAQQELTHRVMYDLVWSKAMTKVAEELGISDVGLKRKFARNTEFQLHRRLDIYRGAVASGR
jgi:hypothetical protein